VGIFIKLPKCFQIKDAKTAYNKFENIGGIKEYRKKYNFDK